MAAELLEKEVLNTAELDAIIGLKTSPPEEMQGEKPEQALLQLDN